MSEDIVRNNPKKEVMYTLVGIALLLAIILLIGVSAFLRPAGEHISAETVAIDTEDAAPAATVDTAAPEDATATPAVKIPADATVTPAPSTGDAIVAAEAGTATAEGTVNQAAVADVDLTAEQADGDLDAGDADNAATAQ